MWNIVLTIGFWLTALNLVHIYITYPLLLFLMAKVYNRPIRSGPHTPSVTIIIPGHNEAAVIDDKIQNTLSLDYPGELLQIIAVSDGSTDDTGKLISHYDGKILPIIIEENQGKSNAINVAMRVATGDVVVFTDANVMLDRNAIKMMVRNFKDPDVGCVCGQLTYGGAGASPTAAASGMYWRYDEMIKKLESQTGSLVGADGSIFGIRRELFTELDKDFIDDFATSMIILAKGYRIVMDADCMAHEISAGEMEEELSRRRRIANRLWTTYRMIRKQLRSMGLFDRYKFFYHRLLRWHSISLMIVTLVLNIYLLQAGPLYFYLLITQGLFYSLAALGFLLHGWMKIRLPNIIFIPYYFTYMNITQFLGIIDSIRGIRRTTWQSPQSTRIS